MLETQFRRVYKTILSSPSLYLRCKTTHLIVGVPILCTHVLFSLPAKEKERNNIIKTLVEVIITPPPWNFSSMKLPKLSIYCSTNLNENLQKQNSHLLSTSFFSDPYLLGLPYVNVIGSTIYYHRTLSITVTLSPSTFLVSPVLVF